MVRAERRNEPDEQIRFEEAQILEPVPSFGAIVSSGIVAGLFAGIVMALVAMFRALGGGLGFWLPMKQVAAVFFGVDALIGAGGVVFVGVIVHLIASAVAGVIFAALGGARLSAALAFWWGMAYGGIVWIINTFATLPAINPVMSQRVALIAPWWFGYHLIFGAMLLFTPLLCRSFSRR